MRGVDVLFWRRRHEIRDEELSAYVDGELSVPSLQRVESHLESCVACRETVAELRAVHEAVIDLPRVRAPRSFALREADVLEQPTTGTSGLFSGAMPLLSGVAAIAIVAFVTLAGVDVTSDGGSRSESAGAAIQESNAVIPVSGGETEDYTADSAAPPAVSDFGDTYEGSDGERNEAIGRDDATELTSELGDEGDAVPGPAIALDIGDETNTGLRIAEGAAAAIAISAGGAALFLWWRRRQSDSI